MCSPCGIEEAMRQFLGGPAILASEQWPIETEEAHYRRDGGITSPDPDISAMSEGPYALPPQHRP